MKALVCEMCESTNFMKEEGVFVCQSCGVKYSVEEAKRMMIDGTVEVTGVVKIDTSSELRNLYEIARRAKDADNSENAVKYYDMILVKDPGSWEANFYVVYFRSMSCKIAEIQGAAISVSNCIESTLNLVKASTAGDEQAKIVLELYTRSSLIAQLLYNGARNHYNDIDYDIRNNYTQEYLYNVSSAKDILYTFGDYLIHVFGDTYGITASDAWKKGIEMHLGYMQLLLDKVTNKNVIVQYAEKIKKYDETYQTPAVNTSTDSSGGCYIATAVYGSYDCSEVWVLRRFRDNQLAKTWYGRAFIDIYYAISPTIVKWFGNTIWVNEIWRNPLNELVARLRGKGVEDTPYSDN